MRPDLGSVCGYAEVVVVHKCVFTQAQSIGRFFRISSSCNHNVLRRGKEIISDSKHRK